MERISANLLGPGVVRARPPNPTYLTTKAAQMLETLEARLAAQSEAFFPDLRPALPTGPRSHPPLMRSTKPNPSTTLPGAPKAAPKPKITSPTETSKPLKKSEDVFAPDRKLPLDRHGNKIPDTDAPHTQLGSKISKKTKKPYPQAREFDAQGKPIRDIDFTDHGRPHEHPNPHQHVYKDSQTGGTLQRKSKKGENPGHPVPEWSYE
ncbi:MAG: hypothetical protein KFB95_02475 [Simkaniaceae bacterium]|nr:MAG: hypothetical protein KFB95_02475 [Simkaniaceae bacterium]